jgi:hypothetical protein
MPVIGALVVLAACGAPPEPLPTAPPESPTASGAVPSAGAVPGQALPGGPPTAYPAPTLPPATLPAVTLPPVTLPPVTLPATTPPSPTPSPAGRCTGGPTRQQILDVINGKPGIPPQDLKVTEGPYCSRSWQFAIVGIAGADPDQVEPLLVVTRGRPAALTLVEAGTDVCTGRVQDDAPPGIRVRACGA